MNMESNSDTELTASRPMFLPCGGTAYLDPESSIWGFRCDTCFAIVGSIGQPSKCKEESQKYSNWAKLGGKGWDYNKGKPL